MADYTEHYQLHQWEPEDPFLRTDFNTDLAKIDATLNNLAETATALEKIVVSLGNCRFHTSSYMGTGTQGNWSAPPNSLTFPQVPYIVAISAPEGPYMLMFRGADHALAVLHPQYAHQSVVTWNGKTVSWYTTSGVVSSQMNEQGVTYQVLALLAADE